MRVRVYEVLIMSSIMKGNTKYLIKSVQKACNILSLFNSDSTEMGTTELSKKLNLSKSSVHKILLTLEYEGFLVQNKTNDKYSLSTKFFEIACSYLNKMNFSELVKPLMEHLVDKFNETAHFAVLDDNEIVFVEKMTGNQPIQILSKKGKRCPIYCTSSGKIILANLTEEKAKEIVDNIEFKKFTNNTITSKEELLKEIDMIKDRGYSIDDEEFEVGIKCIGLPIKNISGNLIGSLSITGPKFRMTDEKIRQIFDSFNNYSIL